MSRNSNDRRRRDSGRTGSGRDKARSNINRRKERDFKRELADKSSAPAKPGEPQYSVQQKRAVDRLLSGIGTPEPRPIVPDDFQIEALEAIEHEDVLVTAPTGSGKTWIAREEIRRLLANGQRAWYTTPLKASTLR